MEFERESREELEKRKHLAKMAPIVPVSEVSNDSFSDERYLESDRVA